jgi:serine/threonine protein phosphatase 1
MELPGSVGDDVQIFAIGDVHGQAATLEKALAEIAARPRRAPHRRLVLLGDLIDRGPESLRSIALAREAAALAAVDEVTCLFGNHELLLLDAIHDPARRFGDWVGNGGRAVLRELGREDLADEPSRAARELSVILAEEIAFLRGFGSHAKAGDLLFVHAGVDPNQPLEASLAMPPESHRVFGRHWAWVRAPFLRHEMGWDPFGRIVVVHGHTSANFRRKLDPGAPLLNFDCVETHRRINLDAGAKEFDQVMLLECVGSDYRLELIQERPLAPNADEPRP